MDDGLRLLGRRQRGATYDNHFGRDYHFPVEDSTVDKPRCTSCTWRLRWRPSPRLAARRRRHRAGSRDPGRGEPGRDRASQVRLLQLVADAREHGVRGELRGARDEHRRHGHIVENIQVFFVEPQNGFFAVDSVYGRADDEQKFDFFCNAALSFAPDRAGFDILHCHIGHRHGHDAYWSNYHNYGLWKPKVVFTIHNMNYGQQKISERASTRSSRQRCRPRRGRVSGTPRSGTTCTSSTACETASTPRSGTRARIGSADELQRGQPRGREAWRGEEIQGRFGLTWGSDQPMVAVVSQLTAQKVWT